MEEAVLSAQPVAIAFGIAATAHRTVTAVAVEGASRVATAAESARVAHMTVTAVAVEARASRVATAAEGARVAHMTVTAAFVLFVNTTATAGQTLDGFRTIAFGAIAPEWWYLRELRPQLQSLLLLLRVLESLRLRRGW